MHEHAMTAHEFAEEQENFSALKVSQAQLSDALNSLGGRKGDGLKDTICNTSCILVNRAADAFILLRNAKRVDAAKLLIRPALEAVIRALAVDKEPGLLLRIAYSDWLENRKWYRAVAKRRGEPFDEEGPKKQWQEFLDVYVREFPSHPVIEKELKLWEAAQVVGPEGEAFYDTHYRLYCKFTHGQFEATAGGLNDLTLADTRTMLVCTNAALHLVHDIFDRSLPQE